MSLDLGGDWAERAVFRLGPMDGKEHSIESDTAELSVANRAMASRVVASVQTTSNACPMAGSG